MSRAAVTAANPSHPDRLGRYEILGSLASGGMAELFLARLPGVEGFAKRVVIKRVLPGLARDREFVEMFLAEARLAASLDHQNIVHVHDIGHDAGGYFFAMELLHGADVASVLRAAIDRDGALALGVALEIARGACAGLHYAHDRTGPDGAPLGLVHRDVSPQNLFVTFDGAVKLLDFGIAKAVPRISNHYTRSGTLRGKLPYMSPEQCRAEPLDRRSDVFSLAVVLWELTTGARLYGAAGEGDFAVLRQIVDHDAPSPSVPGGAYPAELARIVMKGLRRDPQERYQTADALHAELEAFVRERSLWTTARDLAAVMAGLFPDRAAAWRSSERDEPGGEIVAFPGARHTVELPPDREPAAPGPAPAAAPTPTPTSTPIKDGPGPAPAPPRAAWIVAIVAAAGVATAVGFALGRGRAVTGAAPARGPAPASGPRQPVTEDAHWFQPDDYLIGDRPYRGERLDGLVVGKMLRSPPRAGGRTRFLDGNGRELETEHYWSTRIARPPDLAVGALAFCRVEPYQRAATAPRDKDDARTRTWTLARVAEVASLDAGLVSVGNVACDVAGIRVVAE